YYYESNGDIQKSARPDESRTINVAAQPETRRVIAEEVLSKPAGSSHHQNHASDPFETSKQEHTKTFDMIVEQSASAKSKNVFSSPRIVGKTYLSASDHLEDADAMPQQTTSTTSTVVS
ncbi:unnamed protein product, partial [Anisakis simplex]|uniref:Serine/threonine protein kinase n=1 Tax=Anisakis simplex TaxID=6269 RepID=A0A0M3JJB8_ANISI